MKIAIGSIFRDSSCYLPQYLGQVYALNLACFARGDDLHPIWVEGDSTDDTLAQLQAAAEFQGAEVLIHNHGGPKYGSVDDVNRWRQVAPVCNAVLEQVTPGIDAVIYVESDLIWDMMDLLKLVDRLSDYPAIGGLCYHAHGFFYDTYAYRMGGQRFGSDFQPQSPEPFQVESIGSCIVMRGEVARVCRFGLDTCLIGESLKEHGYGLWVDPTCRIEHP